MLLVVTVVCIVGMTSAVSKCYKCDGSRNPGCNDPFDTSKLNFATECRKNTATCYKHKVNGTGNETITAVHYCDNYVLILLVFQNDIVYGSNAEIGYS